MIARIMRSNVVLALTVFFLLAFSAPAMAKGPSSVSLSVNKSMVAPGDSITVSFSVNPSLSGKAWIGILPSHIPHGSEAKNDQHDITYQYLNGRTQGSMSFNAPTEPGTYDFRFHDRDDNGVELAFVSFMVGGQSSRSAATPPPATSSQNASISIDKNAYRQGESIRVRFTAPAHYADNAWIGIIPADVPHGDEAVNDRYDITYQYIKKRTHGEMVFTAPKPGRWDLRLHDTDSNGREVASVTFTVH